MIGFVLLDLSILFTKLIYGKGRLDLLIAIAAISWILSVIFTAKYIHKYPQRYFTYLIASHLKAAIIMAILLWLHGLAHWSKSAPT